jgi:hypothetical protein
MRYLTWIWLLCPLTYAAECPKDQPREASSLIKAEQTWAQSLEQRDAATLGCLLADEFEDADPTGKLTDRATTLAGVATRHASHNELTKLKPHILGDVGYIRGIAIPTDAQGAARAQVLFTDIYVYRDGRWQCVAAHESLMINDPKLPVAEH